MSQFSEIMDELAALREQNAWLVSAVRYLLQGRAVDWQPEAPVDEYQDELDLGAPDPNEHFAVRENQPRTRGCPHIQIATRNGMVTCLQCGGELGCSHNQSGIVNNRLTCLRCQQVLGAQGVIQDRVGPGGNIMHDPNPPMPRAGQGTHEASSKNPGIPLVAHDVRSNGSEPLPG